MRMFQLRIFSIIIFHLSIFKQKNHWIFSQRHAAIYIVGILLYRARHYVPTISPSKMIGVRPKNV